MILLVLPFVSAKFPYYQETNGFTTIGNETFTGATPLANMSGTCTESGGDLVCFNQFSRYVHELITVDTDTNYTIFEGNIKVESTSSSGDFVFALCSNNATSSSNCFTAIRLTGSNIHSRRVWDGNSDTFEGWTADGTVEHIQLVYSNIAGAFWLTGFVNGTEVVKQLHDKDGDETTAVAVNTLIWGREIGGSAIIADSSTLDWVSFNGSVYNRPQPTPPDTTPPGLLDSFSWVTSSTPACRITNQPCETDDTTPTLNATMNETSTCASVANNSALQNSNYTDIINNYNGVECSTTGQADQECTDTNNPLSILFQRPQFIG